MPFDWTTVGQPPAASELEVTIMGPGFGESIVIHVGDGEWVIVDSCNEPGQHRPAPLNYLEALGINASTAVTTVVATHWDQDHVKGIGDVIETCSAAKFSCASAFLEDEFQNYIEVMSIGPQDRGAKDIQKAFNALSDSGRVATPAFAGLTLLRRVSSVDTQTVRAELRVLSPSEREYHLFLQEIASSMPPIREALRVAVARTPNLASVVLALQWEDCDVLLGADMERREEIDRGWNAVISTAQSLALRKSGLVKIPHHGSVNAHQDGMWNALLIKMPIATIVPFGKGVGASRPPTERDVVRVRSKASELLITAPHNRTTQTDRDAGITRSFRESGIRTSSVSKTIGLVRFRRNVGESWNKTLLGPAFQVP
jgi:hypothetical protein